MRPDEISFTAKKDILICAFGARYLKTFNKFIAAEAEADSKVLIRLIESLWRFEVSSQAANDLGMQKWNKITLVSLASDVKKLRDYPIRRAHSAIDEFRNNSESMSTYRTLVGELQRLPLHIYENCCTNSQNYKEFLDIEMKDIIEHVTYNLLHLLFYTENEAILRNYKLKLFEAIALWTHDLLPDIAAVCNARKESTP
ncbi:hypothetical protein HHI36_016998 [Cryptolaemus montrouzieri]|uniref:Uncharacterized protein n=1 Tax=Cryptolaemus montrouzieri TaxID=559131 RepID=A0ABD2NLC3_9CUCU